jgi:hypothetical protein
MEQQINPYAAPAARVDDAPGAIEEAPELWGPESAGAWSLLLSVAFGAWIVWQNWEALGDDKRAATSKAWFIGCVIGVALIILLPFGRFLGFVLLLTWYFAENKPQIKYVKEHFGKEYPHRPWLKVVVLGLLIVLACSFAIGLVSVFIFRH